MSLTQQEIEFYLDNGKLWAVMHQQRFWKLYRDGNTIVHPKRQGNFTIPVKAGKNVSARITHTDKIMRVGEDGWQNCRFIASENQL